MRVAPRPLPYVWANTGAESQRWRWALPAILLITVLWRIPSLFDPPWLNDEGTYFAVAQALSRGVRLYAGIWENKPPSIYLLYGAIDHVAGPSVFAIRLAATAAVAVLVILVYRIGTYFGERSCGLVAALATGLLMGVPVLEGTTANAEVFLAMFSALGVYAAIVRGWGAGGGVALAAAISFKAVAAFDAAAVALWLTTHRPRSAFSNGVGLALAALAGLALAALDGIVPAMVRDAFLYDVGYVGHGNGGAIPWLLGLKLIALVTLSVGLRRAPFPYLWFAYAAAGVLFSGRFFGHYALQAVAPATLSAALLFGPIRNLSRVLAGLAVLALVAAVGAALVGWAMAATGHDSIGARRLQYYANFVRYAAGTETAAAYRAQVDDTVNRNLQIAHALRAMSPGPLLVWGNSPWIYVLSDRRPATIYTSAMRTPEVPGETAALRWAAERGTPREIVLEVPAQPPLGQAARALRTRYRPLSTFNGATIYVRRR